MTAVPLTHLGDLTIAEFLRDYWQQQPVFIKNALPLWRAPLDGNDLAGLALEPSVESRLIIETPSKNPRRSRWQLEHGPLAEERFSTLPDSHFTLLIQALDQISPPIHALLHQFRFLPNWRIDDVMASVAATGGSVGPHFDYYDVFLLQATGQRHWRLGQHCTSESPLEPDCPLKILCQFESSSEYVANPGDLLYIPANLAHWGVSNSDDCTTYSIGFRAPSYSDLLLDLSQDIASQLSPDIRFRDVQVAERDNHGPSNNDNGQFNKVTHELNCGEIPFSVARQIATQCQSYFSPERVAEWLGKHLTEPKRQAPEVNTEEFTTNGLRLAADARAAYTRMTDFSKPWSETAHQDSATDHQTQTGNVNAQCGDREEEVVTVFINGDPWPTSLALAQALCNYTDIESGKYCAEDRTIIEQWIEHGYLIVP